MKARRRMPAIAGSPSVPAILATVALLLGAAPVSAQVGGRFGSAVGGISIDAAGVVRNVDAAALEELAAERRAVLANDALPAAAGDLRKVSLARVVATLREAATAGTPVPVDVAFLGGLERITHVFVDPDRHDVVLAGPADAAAVAPDGTFVAARSRRPLLQLEDLITALRAIDGARQGGMRCSIDPTPEGVARVQQFLASRRTIGPDPQAVFRGMEQALGPQVVTVGGVPADSRFARVLVAADYRLKRIGMGLEPSGVAGLPSYLAMVPPGGKATSLPRFWLEAEYDPLARDADELAWRLSGRRMKCLTESDLLAKEGMQRGQGAADKVAEQWCAAMTKHYDAVAAKQPAFAELVNCVDLAVVAALVHGRQLAARAGLDLGPLVDPGALPLPKYEVPTSVPTVASGLKKGTNWVLSASGGVQFQPWACTADPVVDAAVAPARTAALAARPADIAGISWD
jgi:hypothetical protein